MASSGTTHRRSVPGVEGWWDLIHELPRVSRHTYYLWYRCVLCQEASLLSEMAALHVAGKIYELNTDSVLYAGPPVIADGWRWELTRHHRLKGTRRFQVRDEPELVPVPPGEI